MSYSARLPIGTKAIRSRADMEDYFTHLNANNLAGFAAYYSKDAIFKFSGQPEWTVDEFLTWIDKLHADIQETLSLEHFILGENGTKVAMKIRGEFRGIGDFKLENMQGRFGPVGPGRGPTLQLYVWYTLDKDGHLLELVEDAYLLKKASLSGSE